ncbi:AAA family ATPase, partial [Fischerella thermalis CCMEE 5196]
MKSSFEYLEDLLANNYPIIACESPLQERHRFLIRITTSCRQVGKKVYIWNLSEDRIKELVFSPKNNLIFQEFHDYKPSVKQNTEDYFQVLNFWRVYSGTGVLIVENIFPWLKESITKDTEFVLLSEWIKSSLVNLKFHTNNSDKTTILLGANAEIASEIAAEIPLWSQELPDTQEIIASLISSNLFPLIYTEQDYLEIANASAGLYISDIIHCLNDIRK